MPATSATKAMHGVYYQPRIVDLHDPQSEEVPDGVFTMVAEPGDPNSWTTITPGDPSKANAYAYSVDANKVQIIGGFSLGRMGPDRLLHTTPLPLRPNIRRLAIVAPGNGADLDGSYDSPDASERYADWLGENRGNTLAIYADERTAEKNHAAMRDLYLRAIANTAVAGQVYICDTGLGHEAAWNHVKAGVFNPAGLQDPFYKAPGSTVWQPAGA